MYFLSFFYNCKFTGISTQQDVSRPGQIDNSYEVQTVGLKPRPTTPSIDNFYQDNPQDYNQRPQQGNKYPSQQYPQDYSQRPPAQSDFNPYESRPQKPPPDFNPYDSRPQNPPPDFNPYETRPQKPPSGFNPYKQDDLAERPIR
jgi:hypothetical protein